MINVGEHCIDCGESVAWGSGNYVNRTPADDGEKTGWRCAECMGIECQRCGEIIGMDEDVTPDSCGLDEFSDGAHFVHPECLTPEEEQLMEEHA